MVLSLPLMASAQEEAPKAEIIGGYSFLQVRPGNGVERVQPRYAFMLHEA